MEKQKINLAKIRKQWLHYALRSSKCNSREFALILREDDIEFVRQWIKEIFDETRTLEECFDLLARQGILPKDTMVFPDWRRFIDKVWDLHYINGKWTPIKGKRGYEIRRYLWEQYKTLMNAPDIPRDFFTYDSK